MEASVGSVNETRRPFQFRQGLDERIIAESPDGEEIAKMLSQCKISWRFYFCFDNWQDREKIVKSVKNMEKNNPRKELNSICSVGIA